MRHCVKQARQRGSALMAALFLIVVVAALGVAAMRLGNDQRHSATLELLQIRAGAAANAGLEYWTRRAFVNNNIACTADTIAFDPLDRLDGFTVLASCVRIPMEAGSFVYYITAVATHGNYGEADYVRRTVTRRATNLDPANSGWQSIY